MTSIELEAGKARLIKEILMEVNDMDVLDKMSLYLIKGIAGEAKTSLPLYERRTQSSCSARCRRGSSGARNRH